MISLPARRHKRAGEIFRRWRLKQGLLQKQVAYDAGMTPETYKHLELRSTHPKLRETYLVCKVLGKTLNDLVEEMRW